MKVLHTDREYKVRNTHFPLSIFLVTLFCLLVMAALHTLLIGKINQWGVGSPLAEILVVAYWVAVSCCFTLFTRYQMRISYEQPMKQLAKAADAVAHGDFSIYVPPVHTAEKLDYLDIMIMDFNTMVEELGSIETLKTEFFSNVSHEIKTPLAVIQNYAEHMQKQKLSEEERRESLETIIQASKRLSDLISNILKLNKLEKQSIQPVEEPYDLCGQLCECALRFEAMWEERGIVFEGDLEDRVIIEADASLLELVWNNLLSNALKFTGPGGSIFLRQTSGEGEVVVSVQDSGCGMSKETMKHIFDKFYQGDTSHAGEGNGLGLALVLRVLQLAGGCITADSEPGKGTVFTVRLPVSGKKRMAEGSEGHE